MLKIIILNKAIVIIIEIIIVATDLGVCTPCGRIGFTA